MFAAGFWQVVETQVTVPASGTAAPLVPPDNQRWAFVVSGGSGNIAISTTTKIGTLGNIVGITIPSTGPLLIRYADYGGLAQAAWFVQSTGPTATITLITMRLLAKPPEDA